MSTDLFSHGTAELQGRVLHRADVRVRPIDGEGHMAPTLCFDIETAGPTKGVAHIEQPFPADHYEQARIAASRLRVGMQVRVDYPLRGPRLVIPNATHVHVVHEEPAP
jgi:hypothetical protein